MIVYLDTSAALKLVIQEPDSDALAADLDARRAAGDELVSSWLLHTELHCATQRRRHLDAASVQHVLDAVTLIDVERRYLQTAASSLWGLRSADAIHLATALDVEADELVAYDAELCALARRVGLPVSAPAA